MEYYPSDFHEETVEWNQFSYDSRFEFSPLNPSIGFSSYDPHDPRYFQYDAPFYGNTFEHASSKSSVACPSYSFSLQPEFSTHSVVSYCNTELHEPEPEPELDDYDPIPYVSGYDINQTYGKPLPPTDEICYPRSVSDPNSSSMGDFSYGSVTSPYGRGENDEKNEKPRNGSIKSEEEQQSYDSDGDGNEEKESDLGDDYSYPYSGFDEGLDEEVPQIPPGYGLEAVDLCESLFGYWPCLDRRNQNNHGGSSGGSSGFSCWDRAADYLFGNPYPYGYGHYANP
ncbi:hypothetical protein Nepgr_007210 [Nepenthes gracilis]|uniref:Uncharacterized protein n=1 Tax=Nepenthes gracilis TaxID=150966 RepID=A0AAD3XI54_NEPGR|nr:hypothetical protein Nepgr_007210 [Nepenthes gracilis]